jgi:hypothetical protein
MQYGDISNDIPQRIIVTTDVFVMLEMEKLPKKYKAFKQSRKKVSFKKEVLSQLFLWAVQPPVIEFTEQLFQNSFQKLLIILRYLEQILTVLMKHL